MSESNIILVTSTSKMYTVLSIDNVFKGNIGIQHLPVMKTVLYNYTQLPLFLL